MCHKQTQTPFLLDGLRAQIVSIYQLEIILHIEKLIDHFEDSFSNS